MAVFQDLVQSIGSHTTTPSEAAESLYAQLTPSEKLWLLDGDIGFRQFFTGFFVDGYCYSPVQAGAIDRLGIPGIRFSDGPRGIQLYRKGTAFPASSTRAQTFDPKLEEEVVRTSVLFRSMYLTNPHRASRWAVSFAPWAEITTAASASTSHRTQNGAAPKNHTAKTRSSSGHSVLLSPVAFKKTLSRASSISR